MGALLCCCLYMFTHIRNESLHTSQVVTPEVTVSTTGTISSEPIYTPTTENETITLRAPLEPKRNILDTVKDAFVKTAEKALNKAARIVRKMHFSTLSNYCT